MLSRLIVETEPDVAPVVWRAGTRSRAPAAGAGQQPAKAGAEEAGAALQQQLRQAYESGYREGEAAGKRGAEDEVRKTVEKLAATVAGIAGARGEVVRRAEADIVRLSIEIARRILHRELSVDASALEALIRAALEKLSSQEVYRVRVHPDQEQLMRACLQRMGRPAGLEVVSDPSQERGGAIFETACGSLDASVDTQLREIERGLADRLGDRP
ncbi:MAG: FliH/SctL family protein [Bryobacteraceae bacterium]|jgi:flagellar assembly protein FliH